MSDTARCEFAHDDAAYVLGALPSAERLAFERHLATCADCAQSVRQVAGLPGLLARVPVDVVESAPPPEPLPDTLLPALLDEVRRGERRRRWTLGLASAAAVAAVAGASVVVAAVVGDDGPPVAGPGPAVTSSAPSSPTSPPTSAPTTPSDPTTAPPQDMRQIDQDLVTASVSLTPVTWGTRLDLTCTYDVPAKPPPGYQPDHAYTYTMVVRSTGGEVEQVASWKALPGKTMHLTGATAFTRRDIARVEIRTASGRPVLAVAG